MSRIRTNILLDDELTQVRIVVSESIKRRLVTENRMIGIPKEYGRYMHQYKYSMHIY